MFKFSKIFAQIIILLGLQQGCIQKTGDSLSSTTDTDTDTETSVSNTPNYDSSITAVVPDSGESSGGTAVSITGTGFIEGATITIGGVPCVEVVFISTTSLSCNTRTNTVGVKNILVTNPDGNLIFLSNAFTYTSSPAPSLISISPVEGEVAGGAVMTLFGVNFLSDAFVTIGGVKCPILTLTERIVTCTVPPGSLGAKNVVLTNPDAQASTLKNSYSYVVSTPLVFTVLGQEDGGLLGSSLVRMDDLNDDTLPEIAIAEVGAEVAGVLRAGRVHIYTSAGALLCTLQSPLPSLRGSFGFAMASGNMDADPKPELVISEPHATVAGFAKAGLVYVFSGLDIANCAGGILSTPTSNVGSGVFQAPQPQAQAQFGFSLASGRIDHSSRSSMIVGEPYADAGGSERGQVYVINEDGNFIFNTATLPMRGSATSDFSHFGFSVTAVNLQGAVYDDVIVGEPDGPGSSGTQRGRVYIYNSTTGGSSVAPSQLAGSPIFGSDYNYARFGYSLAKGGKLSLDNRDDLIVGEPYMTTINRGKVWVYSYPNTSFEVNSLIGPEAEDSSFFGLSVAGIQDYDGDGYDDIGVGQPYSSVNGLARGRMHIFSGQTLSLLRSVTGIEDQGIFGSSLVGLGDINGDGLGDFAVAQPQAANAGMEQGKTYIYQN